jgi:ATP-binding cassette subfamily B protein/ATP-binding cassette subfamily C protein LapB
MTAQIRHLPRPASGEGETALAAYSPAELVSRLAPHQGTGAGGHDMFLCTCKLASILVPGRNVSAYIDAIAQPDRAFASVDMINTMAELGFNPESTHQSPERIDARLFPALTWDDAGRPIVLLSRRPEGGFVVFVPDADGGRMHDSEAHELRRKRRVIVFPKLREDRAWSWDYVRKTRTQSWSKTQFLRYSRYIIYIVAFGFALNFAAVLAPVFILLTYHQVIGPESLLPLWFIGGAAVIVIASEFAFRKLRVFSVAWVTSRLDYLIGTAMFDKLLRLPPRMLEQTTISSQLSRIKSFESVRDFFAGPVVIAFLELPAVMISFAIIFAVAGSLGFVIAIAAIAYTLTFLLMRGVIRTAMQEAALENSKLQQFNLETIEKLDSIRSDGLEARWHAKHGDLSARTALAQHRLKGLGQMGEQLGAAFAGLTALAILWIGTKSVWAGALNPAALIATVMLSWRALSPFQALCAMIPQFEQASLSLSQINTFMQTPEESGNDGATPVQISALKGQVDLISVSIRYDDTAGPVFMGLNLSAKPGEIVAIAGPNGSGKSSVLKLLTGFQRPLLGSVRLDGFDLRQIEGQSIRRRVAYMPQDVRLFSGSIAENLRHAAPMAEDAKLVQALEDAGAKAEVLDLPHGLETDVSDDPGALLGELLCHRIALARTLLINSNLILIDEQPGAVLRAGFDRDLKRLITMCRGKRTVFFVSYRADFLRMSSKVISLQQNQAPKIGTADQFLGTGT